MYRTHAIRSFEVSPRNRRYRATAIFASEGKGRAMLLPQNSRLVLNFHGIGPKPSWIGSDEAAYWCDDPVTFETILQYTPCIENHRAIC